MENTLYYYADIEKVKDLPDYEATTHEKLVEQIATYYSDWDSEEFPGLAAVYREDANGGNPLKLDEQVRRAMETLIENEIAERKENAEAQSSMERDEARAWRASRL